MHLRWLFKLALTAEHVESINKVCTGLKVIRNAKVIMENPDSHRVQQFHPRPFCSLFLSILSEGRFLQSVALHIW